MLEDPKYPDLVVIERQPKDEHTKPIKRKFSIRKSNYVYVTRESDKAILKLTHEEYDAIFCLFPARSRNKIEKRAEGKMNAFLGDDWRQPSEKLEYIPRFPEQTPLPPKAKTAKAKKKTVKGKKKTAPPKEATAPPKKEVQEEVVEDIPSWLEDIPELEIEKKKIGMEDIPELDIPELDIPDIDEVSELPVQKTGNLGNITFLNVGIG